MSIKGIILDLDDTLIDSERAYGEALEALNLSASSTDFVTARETVKNRLPAEHVSARNRILYFKCLLETRGDFNATNLLSIMTSYEKSLATSIERQWRQLCRESLFANLTSRAALIVVTNENLRTQAIKIRAMDPDGLYFSKVVCSEEYGAEKPDRRLYEAALSRLALKPSECAVVGNHFENDIEPALRLGMIAFLSIEFAKNTPTKIGRPPVCKDVTILDALDQIEDALHG
ncbi:MAG: HAD family hydrolase [Deltaproteobacteria bacterium]|nr:HAD family hydrolase [Deltaproteobacteria bacterium]